MKALMPQDAPRCPKIPQDTPRHPKTPGGRLDTVSNAVTARKNRGATVRAKREMWKQRRLGHGGFRIGIWSIA
jgi:hypothetical protein